MGNSNSVAPHPGSKRSADEKYGPEGVAAYEARSCTDLWMLLLFIGFWVGMFVIVWKAVTVGDYERLTNGVDMYGNICGVDNVGRANGPLPSNARDFTNKKVLYWPALWPPNFDTSVQLCIESCPTQTYLIDDNVTYSDWICLYNTTVPDDFADRIEAFGILCWPPYESMAVENRCVPTAAIALAGEGTEFVMDKLNARDVATTVFSDLQKTWKWMILGVGIAVAVSFIWLVLLRFLAGFFVWSTIILSYSTLVLITVVLFYYGDLLQKRVDSTPDDQKLDSQVRNALLIRIVSYILIAVCAILLILLIWMSKRIKLAIQIIKEASNCIRAMPFIMLLPVGIFTFLALFSAFWVVISMYLGSAGVNSFDSTGKLIGVDSENVVRYMAIYWFFGFLWTTAFVLAFMEMAIAGAVGSWYWNARTPEHMPKFPVAASVYRTIRFHLGTVAFGSLIVAIIQFIRAILRYLQRKLKGQTNQIAIWALRVLDCCFGYLERIIKYINRNAYIMTAIKGYNFCRAAQRAFVLLLSNILRVGAVNVISDFVLFLGKLFITVAATVPIVFIVYNDTTVKFWAIPCLIVAVVSFAIASGFMGVTHMTIDTILLSFCEDSDRNGPDGAHDYYMPKSLEEFVNNSHTTKCCSCG